MSGIRDEWTTDDGSVRLLLGDCLEILPGLGKVDAVVTDPPYGIGFPYASYNDSRENLRALIHGAIVPAIGNSKRAVITPGITNVWEYPEADWVGAWTWDTTTARGFWGWSQWQPILLYGKDTWPGTNSNGGALKADRIHFSGGQAKIDHSDTGSHTCPKPVEFVLRLVRRFTLHAETILDPFMGSGTTGVACIRLGRRFIGIEKEPKYFETAKKRIRDELDKTRLIEKPKKLVQASFLEPATCGQS